MQTTLHGHLVGKIWLPAVDASLPVSCDLTRERTRFTERPQGEVESILLEVVERLGAGDVSGLCYDTNGNKVGQWTLTKR